MPTAAPVYRPVGYRTADQRRQAADAKRSSDLGRKVRVRVYNSKAWRDLKDLARGRDPFCAHCRKEGRLIPWTDLDHIIDMEDGGEALSMDNVQGLCHTHHSRKTAKTRGFSR